MNNAGTKAFLAPVLDLETQSAPSWQRDLFRHPPGVHSFGPYVLLHF